MMLDMLKDAFWKFVTPVEGCWNWKASVGNHGYGQLTYLQQKYTAISKIRSRKLWKNVV